jgi:hypothetical protein
MRIAFALLLAALLGYSIAMAASYHSMYQRLGGYSGVTSISTDLINRLASDPKLSSHFTHVTATQRAELAKYAADYACKEAGDPCKPVRPNISLVTNTPALTESEKSAAIADLKRTLGAHHVPSDIQFEITEIVR